MKLPPYHYKATSGLYRIQNIVSARFYIGTALSLYDRCCQHRRYLRKGVHPNKILQRAWEKYGSNQFNFDVLMVIRIEEARLYEQIFLDLWAGAECCYNIASLVGQVHGYTLSEEHKQKIGQANAKALKGKKLSKERREQSIEVLARWRASLGVGGLKLSAATREKISKAHSGKPATWNMRPKTSFEKRKISETKLGVMFTDEQWLAYEQLSPHRRITFIKRTFQGDGGYVMVGGVRR